MASKDRNRRNNVKVRGNSITISFSEKTGKALAKRINRGEKLTPETALRAALGFEPALESTSDETSVMTVYFYWNDANGHLAALDGEIKSGSDYIERWDTTYVPSRGDFVKLRSHGCRSVRHVVWRGAVNVAVFLNVSNDRPRLG